MATKSIEELSDTEKQQYYEIAYKFFQVALSELKDRLPWRDLNSNDPSPLLLAESLLLPKHINAQKNLKNLHLLACRFTNVISSTELVEMEAKL